MRWKGEARRLPYPCQHLAEAVSCKRRAPLRQEYVPRAGWLFPFDLPERAQLFAADRMHARDAVLQPVDVQQPAIEIDLIPAQRHKFPDPEPMPERNEDHRGIAGAVPPPLSRRLAQLID